MSKAFFLSIVAAAALLMSGSLTATYAASAHNSQAGASGPSNVNAPVAGTTTAHG